MDRNTGWIASFVLALLWQSRNAEIIVKDHDCSNGDGSCYKTRHILAENGAIERSEPGSSSEEDADGFNGPTLEQLASQLKIEPEEDEAPDLTGIEVIDKSLTRKRAGSRRAGNAKPGDLTGHRIGAAKEALNRMVAKGGQVAKLLKELEGAEAEGIAEAKETSQWKATRIDTATEWTSGDFSLPPDLEGLENQEPGDEPKDGAAKAPKKGPKPGSWRRIKMSICGGAPDNMVPFDRSASPWGARMSYQGLYQVPKRRSRSLLWDEGDGGLDKDASTGFPDFETFLEVLDEHDNGRKYADVLDIDKDDLYLSVGSNVTDADEEDCPNERGSNATTGTWSRRMLGRVRTRGGAFGAGTEEKRTGCKRRTEAVPLENNGYGAKASAYSNPGPGMKLLTGCMKDPKKCSRAAFSAGAKLTSMKIVNKIPKMSLGKRRFRSCALVGNAGHMIKKKYGQYIDRHDVVVRFNVADMSKFAPYVGTRTTFRVLNNQESMMACCRGKLPEKARTPIGLVLWYPGAAQEMKAACVSKWPKHKTYQLPTRFVDQEVQAMKAMRLDMQRLGFGKDLDEWKQISTGGHAVLLFSKICDSVSLYGFTTWPDKARSDHYYTKDKKSRSGLEWHDWGGESLAWRMLFSSGKAAICSN